jgi:hypothetical protein
VWALSLCDEWSRRKVLIAKLAGTIQIQGITDRMD